MMKLSDFDYHLPEHLIAAYPLKERSASRLLHLDKHTGETADCIFSDLPNFLTPNDLLVFNNTKVIPARLLGHKVSGGKVEVLVERLLDSHRVLAHVRASKSPKPGAELILENVLRLKMIQRHEDLFELEFLHDESVLNLLEQYGHIPLPSYMNRLDEAADKQRYQTIYATQPGAVAAPTAGLHFDEKLLQCLAEKNISTAFLTLHVGAGTFQPVRVENITEHKMHSEYLEVSSELCDKVAYTKKKGGRVIAVGTTSVRALETAAKTGEIKPYIGDTDIFIYPGFQFKCVDALITNFHLPKSSLMMLVSAFAGYENTMKAYSEAIVKEYRFYSYGDAMLII